MDNVDRIIVFEIPAIRFHLERTFLGRFLYAFWENNEFSICTGAA